MGNIRSVFFVAWPDFWIQPVEMRLTIPSDVQELGRGYNSGVLYGRSPRSCGT